MMWRLQRVTVPCAAILAIVASTTVAQVPLTLRGTIESVASPSLSLASQSLVVKERNGTMSKVSLTDDVHVFMLKQASLADLKHGTLVGTTATRQFDGDQKAMAIYIFPEDHRPNGLADSSILGRGNEILKYTEGSVVDTKNQILTINYTGGEKKMTLPANVRIVSLVPATVADIKAGQYFLVPNGRPMSLGTLASTIIVGSNSVDFAM
jgi:hypothetical protein